MDYVEQQDLVNIGKGKNLIRSLCSKDIFWEPENEYRIILKGLSITPPFFVNIYGCIKKIVIPYGYYHQMHEKLNLSLNLLCGRDVEIVRT